MHAIWDFVSGVCFSSWSVTPGKMVFRVVETPAIVRVEQIQEMLAEEV